MMELRLSRSGRVVRCRLPQQLGAQAAALRHYRRLPATGPADHEVVVRKGERFAVTYHEGRTDVVAPPENLTATGLQVLVDQGFHRDLDSAGRAVLHASAITDGTEVWAFWGSSGAGKTTVAQALCRRMGWQMISNGSLIAELTDGELMVHGTAKRNVKPRASSQRQQAASGNGGPNTGSSGPSGSAGYEDKEELLLTDDEPDYPLSLTRFVLIRIVATLPGAYVATIDPRRIGVRFYEDMARHLHGAEAILLDPAGRMQYTLPSANNPASHRRRADLATALSRRATALTGPLDDCVSELAGASRKVTGPGAE